jgi:hypothetical protein
VGLGAGGCGSDEDGQGRCANPEEPVVLELADLTPARDETVPNREIVHAFTVQNATGTFESFSFTPAEAHTAGTPTPMGLTFKPMGSGEDVIYTFEPVVWATAGHVELVELGEYTDSKLCFILPRPIFAYDVVAE